MTRQLRALLADALRWNDFQQLASSSSTCAHQPNHRLHSLVHVPGKALDLLSTRPGHLLQPESINRAEGCQLLACVTCTELANSRFVSHQCESSMSSDGFLDSVSCLIVSKRASISRRMGLVSPCSWFKLCCAHRGPIVQACRCQHSQLSGSETETLCVVSDWYVYFKYITYI